MVLNGAVQALRQAEDLKVKLSQGNEDAGILSNRTLLLTQLQKAYQKVLLLDLDYALDKKVEQDLWNVGFKTQIEALQNSAKDKKNPRRAESQTLLSWVLQAATGFYVCLLHQICTAFKLNLPFRCNIPIPAENTLLYIAPRQPQPASCWYICQHCLVHLGDLARYSRQPRVADSFYRQALSVSPRNGQPYNQLGLLRAARGDRLGAAYYHARGLAVGGPFPPAANNLNRTLAASSAIAEGSILEKSSSGDPTRLSAAAHTASYMAALHWLLGGDLSGEGDGKSGLEHARSLLQGLGSTLVALVATQHLTHDTLLKMCCLDIYAVYAITDGHKLSASQLSEEEEQSLGMAMELVGGTLAALLLPAHTTPPQEMLSYAALPAVKVLMEWIKLHPDVLKDPAFVSRLQLWPGLCTLLNGLQLCIKDFSGEIYVTIPLPEDEELQGYLPIDKAFVNLKFPNSASSLLFAGGTDDSDDVLPSNGEEISEKEILARKKTSHFSSAESEVLKKDKSFVDSLRAYRLLQLGRWLANHQKENGTEYISVSENEDMFTFTPVQNSVESNPDLLKAIEELSLLREKRLNESLDQDLQHGENIDDLSDGESKSVQTLIPSKAEHSPRLEMELPPPIVISEADFREKVRKKKAGILKPQGSLERARIEKERASRVGTISPESPQLGATPVDTVPDATDNQDTGSSCSTVSQDGNICSDVGSLLEPPVVKEKGGKRGRTNVALQAILRKQEESSKQVKFLTPVTTPDSIGETRSLSPVAAKDQVEKKKIIQPKVIKSLASIPTDRKTGGILSLKDKSAGYPHLVNVDSSTEKTELSEHNPEDAKNPTASKALDGQTNMSQQDKFPSSPSKKNPEKNDNKNRPNSTPWSNRSQQDNVKGQNATEDKYTNRFTSQAVQNLSAGNFSYFSNPDQNSSITLPVVNPKEIDVRSAALQKQKSLLQGLGDSLSPMDQFNRDTNMPQYNYWSSPPAASNPLNQKGRVLPPRLANLKKPELSPRSQDPQLSPGQAAQPWPQTTGPHHTWWKPSALEQQGYDRSAYQQSNQTSPRNNYQQNYYQQPPAQTNQQEYQDPKAMYNYSPQSLMQPRTPQNVYPDTQASRYNPGYQPSQTSPGYNARPSYNPYSPAMYPQFTTKFGFAPQQAPKSSIGNDYSVNPYMFSAHQFGLNVNQADVNASGGQQYRMEAHQSLPADVSSGVPMAGYQMPRTVDGLNYKSYEDVAATSGETNFPSYKYQNEVMGRGSVYSLFSGGQEAMGPNTMGAIGPSPNTNTQQSLWSGPGPSPLERLLEQQKQFKFPPNE